MNGVIDERVCGAANELTPVNKPQMTLRDMLLQETEVLRKLNTILTDTVVYLYGNEYLPREKDPEGDASCLYESAEQVLRMTEIVIARAGLLRNKL